MISPDRLVCRAYGAQAQTLGEDSPLATSMPTTPATEVQPEDHRNALDGKVLQKTPVLAMTQAQTCHRSRKCTKVASEPDLAGSLGLSCVRGARRELTEEGQHQGPRCSVRIIIMLWTGRPCRRRQCWLWLKRKRATGPASAPKLRQNRFKYNDYCI
jgi:hypothetical protein